MQPRRRRGDRTFTSFARPAHRIPHPYRITVTNAQQLWRVDQQISQLESARAYGIARDADNRGRSSRCGSRRLLRHVSDHGSFSGCRSQLRPRRCCCGASGRRTGALGRSSNPQHSRRLDPGPRGEGRVASSGGGVDHRGLVSRISLQRNFRRFAERTGTASRRPRGGL